ncbi:MAG: radical SAM protein [candidate division WOR-3 bacterium]
MNQKYNIFLVCPPTPYPLLSHIFYTTSIIPPLGIGYLSSYLNKMIGIKALLLNLYPGLKNKNTFLNLIKEHKPKIIGFSVMTETFKNGVRLAKIVKDNFPGIITIFGGPHVTFTDIETLENYPFIDIIVRGEGENTFLELTEKILSGRRDFSDIKGITFRLEDKIIRNKGREFIRDLDKLPFPDRDIIDIDGYFSVVKPVQMVITSRGCPGACRFCAATAMSGGIFRLRSIDNVMEEILEITYRKDEKNIFFGDDTITANLDRFLKLIKELKKHNIKWNAESRVDIITRELCKEMKESGCIALQFGVESGSQEILDRMNKRITLNQIENAVKWAREFGIKVVCSMMMGIPGDTPETIKETIKFAAKLQSKYGAYVVLGCTVPYPGTYISRYPAKVGIKKVNENDYDFYNTDNPIMDLDYTSASEIRKYFYDASKIIINTISKERLEEIKKVLKIALKIQSLYF